MFKKKALVFAFMCCPQFVFSSNGYEWYEIGAVIGESGAVIGENDERIGDSVSLSSDGTILAVGATRPDSNKGLVRAYEWKDQGGSFEWVKIGEDLLGDAQEDYWGNSISLSSDGTILAVGANKYDSGADADNDGTPDDDNQGHAKVYLRQGNSWQQMGSQIVGERLGDGFGVSVSLSQDGSILAVGANSNDGGTTDTGDNRGHVRVYEWKDPGGGFDWVKMGNDIDGEAPGDRSGISVSISNNGAIVAVGANNNNGDDGSGGTFNNSGHVKVYQWDSENENWNTQLGSDIDGEGANDQSGRYISLSGDGRVVAVGAPNNDGDSGNSNDNRGHVRVLHYNGIDWEKMGEDLDAEDPSDQGARVSLNDAGNIVAIGAPNHDASAGRVRVFQWDGSEWVKIGDNIEADGDIDKNGVSVALNDAGDIVAIGATLYDKSSGTGSSNEGHVRVFKLKSPGKIRNDLEQLQDESISQIGFSFGQFSGISAVPFTAMSSAKSFTIGDNLVNPISFQIEYKPRIIIKNSNDLKSLEASASMNFTQNLAMGLDLGIIKKHSGAAVPSGAQIKNNIFKVGINSYYLANGQGEGYYQVGASLNSGKMNLSRQGLALGTESGHGIAGVSILSIIGGYHTKLENWSLPDYHMDLTGKLSRVTRDAYDEASDITNALSYGKFDRDELDLSLSVSKSRRLSNKVNLTLGSAIQGTLLLNQSDATMTEQSNTSNTWTISPKIENQARASVYASLGYKASDKLWVNTTLRAQRDAFDKHSSAYLSVSLSF